MKKIAIILGLCTMIAACSSNKSDQNAGNDSATATNQTATNATKTGTDSSKVGIDSNSGATTSSKGAQLLASSDCLGCHKEQEKLVGPAYKEVAAKYPATEENIDKLANKVITGGSGVWGSVPMSAHPNLALNDAKEMVKYILSLK